MDVVEIEMTEGNGNGATVPARYSTHGYCSCERETEGQVARAVRCAGNVGRGASPPAGKREGFSF
jgi:hypothetical protein